MDESLFQGTCDKACGFDTVGASSGFGRASRDFYIEHARPKQLFLRALLRRGREILRQARLPEPLAAHEAVKAGPCPFQAPALHDLYHRLRALLTGAQMGVKGLSEVIRGHWSAIENGVHHRRDVSFGEDRCRVRHRGAEEALAMFRNLAIALYERERKRCKTIARSFRAWMTRRAFGPAHALWKG